MTKTIPLAEAKKNLSSLIKDMDEKYDRFTITKNGVSKAVVLSNLMASWKHLIFFLTKKSVRELHGQRHRLKSGRQFHLRV